MSALLIGNLGVFIPELDRLEGNAQSTTLTRHYGKHKWHVLYSTRISQREIVRHHQTSSISRHFSDNCGCSWLTVHQYTYIYQARRTILNLQHIPMPVTAPQSPQFLLPRQERLHNLPNDKEHSKLRSRHGNNAQAPHLPLLLTFE